MKELFFTHFVQHLNFTKFTKILFSWKACCFLEAQNWMFQQQQPHILVLMPIRPGLGVALPVVQNRYLLLVGKNEWKWEEPHLQLFLAITHNKQKM